MKPEVQMYFTDPADLSKKYHSQLSQVIKNIVKSAYNKRAITFDIHTPTALCSSPLRSITWSESLKNPWNSETLKNPPVLL